jgi:hypothetical protein
MSERSEGQPSSRDPWLYVTLWSETGVFSDALMLYFLYRFQTPLAALRESHLVELPLTHRRQSVAKLPNVSLAAPISAQ